ncbi:MAG: hypothetical protein JNM95_02480 [Chitinophagaceae bacterium]|nr:hypothetical protein [Chitinophagaceae bacterium]
MRKASLVLIFLVQLLFVQAQQIPFRLTKHNNIVVKAVLNEKDSLHLMFHTGESDVTLIKSIIPKLQTIKFSDSVEHVGSWGSEYNTSDYSLNNTVKMAEFFIDSCTLWSDMYSGYETEGKFGMNLFKDKFVWVNFDSNCLVVSKAIPVDLSDYNKLELDDQNGLLFIKATGVFGKNKLQHTFMIHSGYEGGLLFDDDFSGKNNLSRCVEVTDEKKFKDSFGNIISIKNAQLDKFIVGNFNMQHIPIGFFEGGIGNQNMSVFGGALFKQFNWVFDAQRKYVYIKSSVHFKN